MVVGKGVEGELNGGGSSASQKMQRMLIGSDRLWVMAQYAQLIYPRTSPARPPAQNSCNHTMNSIVLLYAVQS